MLETFRSRAHAVLRSTRGDSLRAVRLVRGTANFVNDLLGRPLASADELAARQGYAERAATRHAEAERVRAARAALHHTVTPKAPASPAVAGPTRPEPAPVVVYTDGQSHRDLKRIADVLRGRDIPWSERSVEEDPATRSWVETSARVRELPVVFIAGAPVGGLEALLLLDASGQLVARVFGAAQDAGPAPRPLAQ